MPERLSITVFKDMQWHSVPEESCGYAYINTFMHLAGFLTNWTTDEACANVLRHVHSTHMTKLIYKKYTEIIELRNICRYSILSEISDSILGFQVICVGFQLVLHPLYMGEWLQCQEECGKHHNMYAWSLTT